MRGNAGKDLERSGRILGIFRSSILRIEEGVELRGYLLEYLFEKIYILGSKRDEVLFGVFNFGFEHEK